MDIAAGTCLNYVKQISTGDIHPFYALQVYTIDKLSAPRFCPNKYIGWYKNRY